ncbi:leukemia inhibitory factor isoform X2 [Ambystoma mexicanum]
MPLDSSSPICQGLHSCGDHIQNQLQRQVRRLNMSADHLFKTYVAFQEFNTEDVPALCNAHFSDFPGFNASETAQGKRAVGLYKVFVYLNTSLGNITQQQRVLHPHAQSLIDQLGNTTAIIKAVLSNLTCLLCNHFGVTEVDLYYGEPAHKIFEQKKKGCQVLNGYRQFIADVARHPPVHSRSHGH